METATKTYCYKNYTGHYKQHTDSVVNSVK